MASAVAVRSGHPRVALGCTALRMASARNEGTHQMKTPHLHRTDAAQFGKYLLVGGGNTALTLIVIIGLKSGLGINPWVANACGYVAGMINSFLWNKLWVFHSHSRRFHGEALRFLIGFGLCYAVQFALTWALTRMMGEAEWQLPGGFVMSPYGLATLIGMGAYTICNYLYNRLVTFHR
ncbi:GtrA family protein [Duncaniella sp. C9]|nr:GtrA family protein [Duncaniella sp. C9]QCP71815.1 GtrA family protein [Duncaniella sp. B8]